MMVLKDDKDEKDSKLYNKIRIMIMKLIAREENCMERSLMKWVMKILYMATCDNGNNSSDASDKDDNDGNRNDDDNDIYWCQQR